jgi:hypothetical protein
MAACLLARFGLMGTACHAPRPCICNLFTWPGGGGWPAILPVLASRGFFFLIIFGSGFSLFEIRESFDDGIGPPNELARVSRVHMSCSVMFPACLCRGLS